MTFNLENSRLFVDTYHKYNNNLSGGEWVNLYDFDNREEFESYIKNLHSDEYEPEFMFTDYEEIPDVLISETNLDDGFWFFKEIMVSEASEAFTDYIELNNGDLLTSMANFDDQYNGWNFKNFAFRIFIERYDLPDEVYSFIDWEDWETYLKKEYNVTKNDYIFAKPNQY